MNNLIKLSRLLLLGIVAAATTSSCNDFIFGKVEIKDEENPLIQKKTPRSGAEIYYGNESWQHKLRIDKDAKILDKDPNGAFKNWYTCLVMLKEGHPHGKNKMHGNYVYDKAAWRQEQFAEIHNTAAGPEVKLDAASIKTSLENQLNAEDPDYFRIMGGPAKMWGLCLYFYDREGRFLNDSILKHSDQYQIFFTISDVDDKGNPYTVLDVRYDPETDGPQELATRIKGRPAKHFAGLTTLEQRAKESPKVFQYAYRDTWTYNDMNDGVRELFNIKLLPPLVFKDYLRSEAAEDVDCVGLKGHFKFDFTDTGIDPGRWPIQLSPGSYKRTYNRNTYLLPKFYLAVRVMKCDKGTKAQTPVREGAMALSKTACAPYYTSTFGSNWHEIIRFNLPIKVFTSMFDSDPTNTDILEPYYYHLSREIGLKPAEAFEAANGNIIHSNDGSGGLGYGAWFM